MKRSFTKWALVALLPLSAMVVGCGGDDDDNGGAGGSTAGTNSGGTSAGGTGGAAGSTAGTSNGGTAGSTAGTSNGGSAGSTAGTAGTSGSAGSSGSAPTGGPKNCQEVHGGTGCCSADGKTNYYLANNGTVSSVTCPAGTTCSWSADDEYYDCLEGTAQADPSGTFPLTCGAGLSDDVTGCDPACTKNADCAKSDFGPVCETATGNCVECLASSDCKDAANPVCTNNACGPAPCTKDADCATSEDGPKCDTTSGTCGECAVDSDCKDAGATVCNAGTCSECKDDTTCGSSEGGKVCTSFGICGCAKASDCAGNPTGAACLEFGFGDLALCGCNTDADCASSTAGKDCLDSGSCGVKCKANTDCKDPTKPVCDVDSGNCGECGTNADCATSTKGKVCNTTSNVCTECLADADCSTSAKGKFCDTSKNTCVACTSDFDCTDPKAPACNAGTCGVNSQCTGTDLTEDADDGPLGATDITPTTGNTGSTTGHSICGLPSAEADYFKFTANDGDTVTLTLSWADTKQDLDITVTDAKGDAVGIDYYKAPAVVKLGYLPKGTYYVAIRRYDGQTGVAAGSPYTLGFDRTTGNKCASIADCAKDGATSLLRGSCNATTGACEAIDGKGAVAKGGACDTDSDCSSGHCAASPFNQNASKFAICTVTCAKDTDCGADQYCTTFYNTNICLPKCTKDTECPADPNSAPISSEPWYYLTCTASTGKCDLPPEE